MAIDLTVRELQRELQKDGLPWTEAKGRDGFCPVSNFISVNEVSDWRTLDFSLCIDGKEKQRAKAGEMSFGVEDLIHSVTQWMTLEPGDILLTGTPSGAGVLNPDCEVEITGADGKLVGRWRTVQEHSS